MKLPFKTFAMTFIIQLLVTAVVHSAEVNLGPLPASDANLDLAVPDTPAFYALGLTPESVSRPASPRELAADLLNGLDKNGNFQSGISLATVPYLLFAGDRLTINDYRNNENGFSWVRLAARTQLSVATAKGTDSEDKSVRAAVGIRVVPYDNGDPRLRYELDKCFSDIQLPPVKPGESLDDHEKRFKDGLADLQSKAQSCREKSKKQYWNASAWELGAAPTWIQKEGTKGQTKWGGAAFWTSYAYGFENIPSWKEASQLILGFRYELNNQAPDVQNPGGFVEQDSAMLGARFILGKPDLHLSFEGSYSRLDTKGASTQDTYRFSLAPEFKLPILDNLWFQVSVGGTGGDGSNDRLFIMSSIRFGNGSTFDVTKLSSLLGHK